jgi:antitoxin MazE
MKTAIRKMGNSHGVIIPKPLLAEIGAKANDQVDMKVEAGRLVIAPLGHDPRAGWSSATKTTRIWFGDEARRSLVGRARPDNRQRNSEDATLPDCLPGCDGQRASDGSCCAAHKQGATNLIPSTRVTQRNDRSHSP